MTTARLEPALKSKSLDQPKISPVVSPEEYIHSSLIHEVYLNNDLKNDFPKFWGKTSFEEDGFGLFFQGIKEIVADIKAISGAKLDHAKTIELIINPVLHALGWSRPKEMLVGRNIIITSKSGDEISIKPTLALFSSENDAKTISEHYKNSSKPNDQISFLPVATTYFGSWADQKSSRHDKGREQLGKFGDIFSSLGTDEQVYNYLDLLNVEWGISTDGHSWRLIKKSAFAIDHNKYFEFNLWGVINALSTAKPHEEDALVEILKCFYWFFSKESHLLSKPNQISLTWERAKKYTDNLEDDLRARFVAAMSIAVNSLWKSAQERNQGIDFVHIQDIAESFIYNALFIRSCESRRILPLHQAYLPYSIHNLVAKLRDFSPTSSTFSETTQMRLNTLFKKDLSVDGSEIFDYILNLFELTNDSDKKSRAFGFAIEGFKENIFAKNEWATLKKIKIENIDLAKVLSTLFYIERDVQLPFNVLTPQQFGSIFESFLEFELAKVNTTQYLVKRSRKDKIDVFWDDTHKSTDEVLYVAKRGSLYFRPNNAERKISGSYYTPDHVVDLIVRETLTPLLKDKSSDEILKIRVCDPAMGSGHFLISALRFIATEYLKKVQNSSESQASIKRQVLHNCIFGADKSQRAVKLGKLALWLETSEPGKALEHLDDQLKVTNSLIDDNLWKKEWKFLNDGIDAVIGNPPYLGEKGNKELFQEIRSGFLGQYYERRMDLFYFFFHLGIDLLKPDGLLGFITTDYYFQSTAACKLREQMRLRSNPLLLIDLQGVKVFKDAQGQHNAITFLKKGSSEKCSYGTISDVNLDSNALLAIETREIMISQLFGPGPEYCISFSGKDKKTDNTILTKLSKNESVLTDFCKVTQGIVTGANRITKKHLKKYPNAKYQDGEGIFVLSHDEVRKKGLSALKEVVKPFFKSSDIMHYCVNEKPKSFLLYLKDNGEKQSIGSTLVAHFTKFKELLVDRLTVCKKNKMQWNIVSKWLDRGEYYLLFYPRKPEVFENEKIVVPQWARYNTFGYSCKPWYATSDVYFLTKISSGIPLKVLTAILNSPIVYFWVKNKGKRKGDLIEFTKQTLQGIPIPQLSKDLITRIDSKINLVMSSPTKVNIDKLNQYIYEAYDLSETEMEFVEHYFVKAKGDSKETKTAA